MAVVLGVARVYSQWRTQGAPPAERTGGEHPKMKIVAEGGTKFVVPYAPRDVTTEGLIPEWSVVARGGRRPLLLRSGEGLPTMSFDLIFGHLDKNRSIEDELGQLRKLAKSGKRFKVTLDRTTAAYQWRLTRFTQQVVDRKHGNNAATRALCQLTFTAASDSNVSVGPLSGGDGGEDNPDRPKFYIVKKGDTLESIAKRFYGQSSAWRKIADANNIRDPKKVAVGDKLRLP